MQTLSDDSRRSAYDKYGAASQQPGFDADAYERASSSFGGAGGFGDFFHAGQGGPSAGAGSPADIFASLFGDMGGRNRQTRRNMVGDDIEATVQLEFQEACKGTSRDIPIMVVVEHATCKGSGIKPGHKKKTCDRCRGSGVANFVVQGGFQMQTTCTECQGEGTITPREAVCVECDGVGKVKERQKVHVDIPAGAEDGHRLQLPGKGDYPIQGKGRPGDLYIRLSVKPSKIFRRQGSNLYFSRTIPFYTAALGGQTMIPTLDSEVSLKIPSGTQQGEEIVMKGRGIQRIGQREFGDLTVKFHIGIPR